MWASCECRVLRFSVCMLCLSMQPARQHIALSAAPDPRNGGAPATNTATADRSIAIVPPAHRMRPTTRRWQTLLASALHKRSLPSVQAAALPWALGVLHGAVADLRGGMAHAADPCWPECVAGHRIRPLMLIFPQVGCVDFFGAQRIVHAILCAARPAPESPCSGTPVLRCRGAIGARRCGQQAWTRYE